jgi:hypothetical protein
MTQSTPQNDVNSGVLHIIDGWHLLAAKLLSGLESTGGYRPELTAHLRCDIGEDDCRPAALRPFLQQEAARAGSVEQMLLRSF